MVQMFPQVVIVTSQLCIFGNYRYAHTKYYTDNTITFEHLFLKGWDPAREIHAYPPATGAYAIYKKDQFYSYFDYIANTYTNIEGMTVNPVFRNSSFQFCKVRFFPPLFSLFFISHKVVQNYYYFFSAV